MSTKNAEVVAVQSQNPNVLEARLIKINELAKAKSFYEKIKERETDINELQFEEGNRNQSLTIIDAEGSKFETPHFPILQEVKQILLSKIKDERLKVEKFLSDSSI